MSSSHPAITLLKQLLAIPAPSGRETRMADFIRGELTTMARPSETDPAGNILVRCAGQDPKAPPAILAAHMDEIALVVTAIQSDGTLRVDRSGALFPHKLGEGPMTVLGDRTDIVGVLSLGAAHGFGPDESPVSWQDAHVITGLSSSQLAAAGVRVGSTAVPTRHGRGPVIFGSPDDPHIGAWTLDDRLGVMTLLRLLKRIRDADIRPARSLIIAFTVHEEGGCHGAKVLCHREQPEIMLAVDGCPIVPPSPIIVDRRPVAWSKDQKCHYDQRLITQMAAAATAAGTSIQTAVLPTAYSDASAVYDSGAAPRVGVIGHARHNSHGYEVASMAVCDTLLNTLVELLPML